MTTISIGEITMGFQYVYCLLLSQMFLLIHNVNSLIPISKRFFNPVCSFFLYSHLPPFLSKSQALLHSLLTWMVLPAESKETPQQSYEVKEPRLESLG
jgi:hypothetical protein